MTAGVLDDDAEFVMHSVAESHAQQSLSHWSGEALGINRRQALNALGEVLYAAELPDGVIKIGWTKTLATRLYHLGAGTTLLAVQAGTYADEQAVHRTLSAHRARGHEHYRRTTQVLALVNDWRRALGLPPLG